LVDELAHTNAPGSTRERWQDVNVIRHGIHADHATSVPTSAGCRGYDYGHPSTSGCQTMPARADEIELVV
jgi:hypothetical protein